MAQPDFSEKLVEVLGSSFRFFISSLRDLFSIYILLFVILAATKFLLIALGGPKVGMASLLVVKLIAEPFIHALLIIYILARSYHQESGVTHYFRAALPFWIPMIQIVILSNLILLTILAIAMTLPPLALLALWLMVKFSLAQTLAVVEKLDPVTALKTSFEKTQGQFWLILASLLMVTIPIAIGELALTQLHENGPGLALFVIGDVLGSFASLLLVIIMFRIYMLYTDNKFNTETGTRHSG